MVIHQIFPNEFSVHENSIKFMADIIILNQMNDQTGRVDLVNDKPADPSLNFPNYLSGLSHDIRTPLSAIIGFSDLLIEPRLSRTEQRSYCLMIARSSRKLLDLMSNLIDLAKMETANLELFFKPVFIKDLVEELKIEINEMCSLYEKKHLIINYNTPPDQSAFFNADKGRVFQVIRILMENSLRFTKEGSITLEIKQDTPDLTTIEIADTGCGIEKDILRILFEMFPGPEAPLGKKTKSRGMSLAVVKKLCDMMGIVIEVRSWVGAGTKFTLSVPRRAL